MRCNWYLGECKIFKDCDYVKKHANFSITITVTDKDPISNVTRKLNLTLDGDDLYIPGSVFADADGDKNCYLPIFLGDQFSLDQNTWILGNVFMDKYYLVYNMEPLQDT